MDSKHEDEPFSEAHLDSPAYRERLRKKLECLIAVLEVACTKVRRSLTGPDPDVERLVRIHKNLRETLEVCLRARRALEAREALPADLPENLGQMVVQTPFVIGPARKPTVPSIETGSDEERKKFEKLAPIGREELAGVDLEDLARRLQS